MGRGGENFSKELSDSLVIMLSASQIFLWSSTTVEGNAIVNIEAATHSHGRFCPRLPCVAIVHLARGDFLYKPCDGDEKQCLYTQSSSTAQSIAEIRQGYSCRNLRYSFHYEGQLDKEDDATDCLANLAIRISSWRIKMTNWRKAISAGGIVVTFVGHPFDTVKVRLQTQSASNPTYCESQWPHFDMLLWSALWPKPLPHHNSLTIYLPQLELLIA